MNNLKYSFAVLALLGLTTVSAQLKSSAGTEYVCGDDADVQKEAIAAEEKKITSDADLTLKNKVLASADSEKSTLITA